MSTWQEIVAAKKAARDVKFPAEWLLPEDKKPGPEVTNVLDVPNTCGILTEREIEITTKYDAVELVEKIAWRVYSVEEVTVAFCKRATIAHCLVNCLTEIFFDEAIERAKTLDKQLAENPNATLPPFFGLPMSFKDALAIKGYDASAGFVKFCNQPCEKNCVLADWLEERGAIIFCKTNLPQTQMTADSDNNIWGRTLNPNNRNLSAGGSSGGEGALIALRGSLLGMGTDIAGSVRIPSLANGIYGFKPTADLIPASEALPAEILGAPGIAATSGPMATSARACHYFMKNLLSAGVVDICWTVSNVRWMNEGVPAGRPLRVGFMEDDGTYTPSPPIRRALNQTVEKLKAAGVEVFPFKIDGYAKRVADIWELFSLDGSESMIKYMEDTGEPMVPSVVMTQLLNEPPKDMPRFMELSAARAIFRQDVHKLWHQNKLDCLLMAGAPHTAVPHDTWKPVNYTAVWNYLNYPAAVIPIDTVKETDVKDEAAKYGEVDEKIYSLYTGPEDYKDAPTSVQLVTPYQTDERLAELYVKLDSIIKA